MALLAVRIHCPAGLTERISAVLVACPGAVHLAVFPGAGVEPCADIVSCDLLRQYADDLLADLRDIGLDDCGAILVQPVDAVMSSWSRRAAARIGSGAADAVVWDDLANLAESMAGTTRIYLAFMAIAMMIAACGIELDNPILIVGAMVVGPDFGPLGALSFGIAAPRAGLARRALGSILAGFAFGIAVTAAFGLLMREIGLFAVETLATAHPNTGFIWRPDAFSFIVSWLGGIAGVLAMTSSQTSSLIGVVISVTTIPAASACAINLDEGSFAASRGAAEQLGINIAGIVGAGAIVLASLKVAQHIRRTRRRRRAAAHEITLS